MSIPAEAMRLARERADRRAAKDFAEADRLRDVLRDMGFDVTDGPDGPIVAPIPASVPVRVDPSEVPSQLDAAPTADVSLQWVVQGWPQDVVRAIEAYRAHAGTLRLQEVVVDTVGTDPTTYPEGVEVIALDHDPGWGAARNVGLRCARAEVIVVLDGSIEPTGDALLPLLDALEDDRIGVAGPFGISTTDLRVFTESPGPRVDAIEAYCMAFRRRDAIDGLGFDEHFKFYRSADIEFSFRIADRGLDRVVVNLPVTKHEHRMWHATPQDERARLSKRNFYRFLEGFRDRTDLLVVDPSR